MARQPEGTGMSKRIECRHGWRFFTPCPECDKEAWERDIKAERIKNGTCEHLNFQALVQTHRLRETDDGPITAYSADVRISCSDCGRPFQFLGLPTGIDTQGSCVSVDGLEARLAICPEGEQPSMLSRIAATFAPPSDEMN